MLQIFNEFAWLMHVGSLDGVKKNSNSILLKLNKKIALICFIEITSILAHAKTQLNPIHLMLLKQEASNFLLWVFKNEIFQLANT